MRFCFTLMAVLLLAGCTKEYGPQRLDFVNTSRYTSSNRVGLSPADTLATRIYAENTADGGPRLGRLVITVRYQPRRNPFLYPTPVNSFSRDSIDKSAENFVFLDSTLSRFSGNPPRATGAAPDSFLLTSTYGVRTTTGLERWNYDLYNSSNQPTASRTVQLNMRRPDSLNTYHDYTLRLVIPAVGVPPGPNGLGRANSTRRFLSLLPGLALPAYTVVRATTPDTAQLRAQRLIDLIILADGLTIVTPDAANLNAIRWPAKYRRATRIYSTGLNANSFASLVTDAGIANIYTSASTATNAGSGQTTGAVKAGDVYAFRTNEVTTSTGTPSYRYGLLLVESIPSATSTTATAGLKLQVRMAKL